MQTWVIFRLLVICMGVIVIAGCTGPETMNTTPQATTVPATPVVTATTNAPVTTEPTATPNQTATVPPTTATTVPITRVPPTITPTTINYSGESGWTSYTDSYDGFSIYLPTDWNLLSSTYTGENVTVTSPDGREQVVFTNETWLPSVANSLASTNTSHQPGTGISDDLYAAYIRNVSSFGYSPLFRVISVTQDKSGYLLNGNPARHLSLMIQYGSSAPTTLDGYLVASGNTYFSVYWGAGSAGISPGPTQADQDNAAGIAKTFTTGGVSALSPATTSDQSLSIVVHYG